MRTLFIITYLFIAASGLYSQAKFTDSIALDKNVHTGKLPNGFTYFIRKNNFPADKAQVKLTVNAGVFHEDEDQLGLAHLLEHMAFNGTKNYPGTKMVDYFNSAGLQPGNDWNAKTGVRINFFMNIPSDNKELLGSSLQIMRDLAQDMLLEPNAIDDERGVVLGESRQKSGNTGSLMEQEWKSKIFGHPKYFTDQIAKHDKNINTFKHKSLIRFYNDWFRPDLQALIVVGNVDIAETEKKIKVLFSDLKMPDHPRKQEDFAARYSVPLNGKNKLVVITNKEQQSIELRIFQKKKAGLRFIRSAADMRTKLIDELYNIVIANRFEVINTDYNKPFKRAVNSLHRNFFDISPQLDALSTFIELNQFKPIKPAIRNVAAEMGRVARDGFTTTELNTAKEKIESELVEKMKSSLETANLSARYEDYFNFGAAAPDPATEMDLYKKLLSEITVKELNAFAVSWIMADKDISIVIYTPDNKDIKIPTETEIFNWWKEGKKSRLPAYKERSNITGDLIKEDELPKSDATSKTKSISDNEELEIKDIQFSNGIRLLLKPVKSDGGYVNLYGFQPGGTSSYTESDYFNTVTAYLITKNGAGRYDKDLLDKFLADKGISIGVGMNRNLSEIHSTCKEKNIDLMLQALYIKLLSPVKDRIVFNNWIEELKESLSQPKEGKQRYRDSIESLTYVNGSYSPIGLKDLKNINLDRTYEIYKHEFSSLSGYTFIMSGNFNNDEVIALFTRYFGGVKAGNREVKQLQPLQFARKVDRIYRMGSNLSADIHFNFPAKYNYSLKDEMLLKMLYEALVLKMRARLREKEGGTYGVNVGYQHDKDMGSGYNFSIDFLCDTNNVEHMTSATIDEFRKLKNDGFDVETFRQVKEQLRNRYLEELKRPAFWTNYIKTQLLNNEDINQILKIGLLDHITLEAVNKAAKQYLVEDNMMRFVLLPERQ